MFTFMAQFKRDQKIIIFSHSLALTIFQPRGPAGLAEGAGLTSSIGRRGSADERLTNVTFQNYRDA